MKKVRVIFSPEAEQVYRYLNEESSTSKIEKSILNALNKKIELIKANIHYGNPVAKKLIPREYKTKYGVTNLFRIELPNFWRMLYTLTDGENKIEIVSFVLDIVDHKEYNKKFGYK
jgi:plasmid maintenance system killer protein